MHLSWVLVASKMFDLASKMFDLASKMLALRQGLRHY